MSLLAISSVVTPLFVLLLVRENNLVQDVRVIGKIVVLLQLPPDIIGAQDGHFAQFLKAFSATAQNVAKGPDRHPEIAMKTVDTTNAFGFVRVEPIQPTLLLYPGQRVNRERDVFTHHGTAAGTSPAVRGGKRLVQIQVKHIDSHLAGAGITHEGIEIGAVHIDEATLLVDNLGDLLDMGFKDPHGIGIGQHQTGNLPRSSSRPRP